MLPLLTVGALRTRFAAAARGPDPVDAGWVGVVVDGAASGAIRIKHAGHGLPVSAAKSAAEIAFLDVAVLIQSHAGNFVERCARASVIAGLAHTQGVGPVGGAVAALSWIQRFRSWPLIEISNEVGPNDERYDIGFSLG